jgi:outer membrane receptor protein involved in Fe transport
MAFPHRKALVIALSMGFMGVAFGQSTTGALFGQVPAAADETVVATSATGLVREVAVDSAGRYRINSLPVGLYEVSLKKAGAVIDTRKNINLIVGAGTEVSFAAAAKNATTLNAVTVMAGALPAIDVTAVDSRTVITSQQLQQLPIGHSAESIALLAPGAVPGSKGLGNGNAVSFGGSSVSENAYYVNGYNTTDPLLGLGGASLPYGAIDQQEVYTGGYSAMYGRSDGGVINQLGKRGTNTWHFGGQVLWEPKFAADDPASTYYPSKTLPAGYGYTDASLPGTIYRRRKDNTSWNTTYSAYVGGPLVQDKLFFYLAAEAEREQGKSTSSSASSVVANTDYKYTRPKYYAKLDWNINDSNILELTDISDKESYEGRLYDYDYATGLQGGPAGYATSHKFGHEYQIGKYTGYLTDDLTLSVTYGRSQTTDYQVTPGLSTTLPYLSGITNQDPAITGGVPIANGVPTYATTSPRAGSKTHGLRIDLAYQLGDHHLAAGIDNMHYAATEEGQAMGGPGYAWFYAKSASPGTPLNPALGVGAPGGAGYYVRQYIYSTTADMALDQKAQYFEDRWQVTDRWLLSLGLRNDQFDNINNLGQSFVKEKNQWAPRLGFSWDVFGDASFKVFGNLGRYYLALPSGVAIRGGSASTYTNEYFTYQGINPQTGDPLVLTPIGPGPVTTDGETGEAPNAKTVAARDLKAEYQDEAILGFSKTLGPDWVTGAKVTVRKLQSAIDDVCDSDALVAKAVANGVDASTIVTAPNGALIPQCKLFNPGRTNTFLLENTSGGFYSVKMSSRDWGFNEGAKRKYYALDLFLEHPFDGTWQARVDYTFSRSYGNTEGQVRSDIGQEDVSKTVDWDFASLMVGSNGALANDRTHQIKAYGSYQISPEWLASGALRIASGSPKSCLGFYGTDESDPSGYESDYHWCNGKLSPPGAAGRLPWTHKIDLAITYRPAFADHKLALQLAVFNVLNERRPIQVDSNYEDSPYTVSNTYGSPSWASSSYYEDPRYARLSATYDF